MKFEEKSKKLRDAYKKKVKRNKKKMKEGEK